MADVTDYEGAVARIRAAEVPDDAVTAADILDALGDSETPQLTAEVAAGVADGLVTVEDVTAAVEESGELPTEAEIGAIAEASDNTTGNDPRLGNVSEEAGEIMVTAQDVEAATSEVRSNASDPDELTTVSDVQEAVEGLSEGDDGREFFGADSDTVAAQISDEIGALSDSEVRQAQVSTLTGDTVQPAEVDGVDSTNSTPASIVRNDGGEAVAVVGGGSQDAAEQVAEAVGAEQAAQSPDGLGGYGAEQGGDESRLTLGGERLEGGAL